MSERIKGWSREIGRYERELSKGKCNDRANAALKRKIAKNINKINKERGK